MRQQKISSSLLVEGKGGMTCLLMRGKGGRNTHNYQVGPTNGILDQFRTKVRGGFRPG